MVGRKRTAGIDPHGSGIRIRIQHKGQRFTEVVPGDYYSTRDLAAAVKRREWLKSRLTLGLPIVERQHSEYSIFAEDAQAYLSSQTDLDYSTSIDYENILNCHWLPNLGARVTQEITTDDIKAVLAGLSVSQKRKRNILNPLRGVFNHADIIPNPASIKIKRDPKRQISRFRPNQRDALMAVIDGIGDAQISAYFAFIFGCGLRPGGEVLGLRWSDYDENDHRLHIERTIVRRRHKATNKVHEDRRVFVPTWVRPYIDALPTKFKKGWMLLNSKGTPYLDTDVFNGAWKKAFEHPKIKHELNLAYRIPYVCRHTRAAELLSNGAPPGKAAKELGHSLEMFYRTYAEWIEEFQGSGTDDLEGQIKASGPKTVQKKEVNT